MYINTAFIEVLCAIPCLKTISFLLSTTTRHMSASNGPSLGVYAVACKLLHCWHTVRIELFILAKLTFLYRAQNFKIKMLKMKRP